MTDSAGWYYTLRGARVGPVDAVTLQRLIQQGGLSPDELVWRQGMSDWQRWSSISELAVRPPVRDDRSLPKPHTQPEPNPPQNARPNRSGNRRMPILLIAVAFIVAVIGGAWLFMKPAYQEFEARRQLGEGSVFSDAAKNAVVEFYASHNRCPVSNEEADLPLAQSIKGKYVSAVQVYATANHRCVIAVDFGNGNASPLLSGQTFGYVSDRPTSEKAWSCAGTVSKQFWPMACTINSDSVSSADELQNVAVLNHRPLIETAPLTSHISSPPSVSAPSIAPASAAAQPTTVVAPATPKNEPEADHCASDAPAARAPEERALIEDGRRHLTGESIRGGRRGEIFLVEAATGYDGMCRPTPYQIYVFRDGVQVGPLTRQAMDPRGDGAVGDFQFVDATHVRFKVRHYTDEDPLCCPSSTEERVIDIDSFREPIGTTLKDAPNSQVASGGATVAPLPTFHAASFDCRKAATVTEVAICSNADLSELDWTLGQAFSDRIAKAPPDQVRSIRTDEAAWIKNRDGVCNGDASCLKTEIRKRIGLLRTN